MQITEGGVTRSKKGLNNKIMSDWQTSYLLRIRDQCYRRPQPSIFESVNCVQIRGFLFLLQDVNITERFLLILHLHQKCMATVPMNPAVNTCRIPKLRPWQFAPLKKSTFWSFVQCNIQHHTFSKRWPKSFTDSFAGWLEQTREKHELV